MNPVSNPRQLVLSYLLGEMPLEERRAVEVQMVSDPGFSHHIRQAELELIEDYRASRMSAEERERVEQAFAREHLFLGLPIRLEPPPPSATSLPLPHSRRWHWWVRLTLATAGIILFVAAAWIAFRYLRPHDALPSPVWPTSRFKKTRSRGRRSAVWVAASRSSLVQGRRVNWSSGRPTTRSERPSGSVTSSQRVPTRLPFSCGTT